jgi:hypothetical protein
MLYFDTRPVIQLFQTLETLESSVRRSGRDTLEDWSQSFALELEIFRVHLRVIPHPTILDASLIAVIDETEVMVVGLLCWSAHSPPYT